MRIPFTVFFYSSFVLFAGNAFEYYIWKRATCTSLSPIPKHSRIRNGCVAVDKSDFFSSLVFSPLTNYSLVSWNKSQNKPREEINSFKKFKKPKIVDCIYIGILCSPFFSFSFKSNFSLLAFYNDFRFNCIDSAMEERKTSPMRMSRI